MEAARISQAVTYCLRPFLEEDLKLVFEWRNQDRVRVVSATRRLITYDEHQKWFEKIQADPKQVGLIFEMNSRPVGTIKFWDHDLQKNSVSWGFYLGYDDLPKGTGTIMGKYALDYAFFKMEVGQVDAEVFVTNPRSIAYHEKLGFMEHSRAPKEIDIGGSEELISYTLPKKIWNERRKNFHE